MLRVVVLIENAHRLEYLALSWWNFLGRIGRCGLVGGKPACFEISEAHAILS